ncbi:MAG: CPBP family intramembrane metalloprotease [Thermoflavifilum sp.]|nr:CPBP family intramembrane metalloprotease [Thermoflavifilum sp.]
MSNKFRYTGYGMQVVILIALTIAGFMLYFLVSMILLMSYGGWQMANMQQLMNDPHSLNLLKTLQSLSSLMIFLLPAVSFAWIADTTPLQWMGLRRRFSAEQLILVIAVMVASLPFIGLLGQWNEHIHFGGKLHGLETWIRNTEKMAEQQTRFLLTTHGFNDYLVNLLMVAVLPGICEEAFFRGVLQKLLIRWSGRVATGVILTAMIFSFLHFQFLGFLPRFVLGIILGYVYVLTGSLWLAMVGHFINNGIDVTLMYLYQIKWVKTDPMGETEVSLWAGLLSGIIVVILFIWLNRLSKHRDF